MTLTLLVYLAAVWLYLRSGRNPFLIPVLSAVVVLIAVLRFTNTSYPVYFEGTKFIHFFVGPVIVALAVPLYSQIKRLREIWLPVSVALLLGSSTAILSAVFIAWALGGSVSTLISLAPKSATMPIAMALADRFNGFVSLAAVAVAVTGIGGTIVARPLLNLLGITDPAVRGFSLGLTAHAIGTARAMQTNETAGAFAALAMALNGVATALIVPLLFWIFRITGTFF
jgi:predicted murein hydrolase (TIGR00659 family)